MSWKDKKIEGNDMLEREKKYNFCCNCFQGCNNFENIIIIFIFMINDWLKWYYYTISENQLIIK